MLESIGIVKPTVINSVPVLYNRVRQSSCLHCLRYPQVYDGVMKVMAEGSSVQKAIFAAALSSSRRRNRLLEQSRQPGLWLDMQYRLFDRLVFAKIRARLGGNIM